MASVKRVGLVGAGEICGYHVRILKEIKALEIAAICDIDSSKAKSVCDLYGIKRHYSNYTDMIGEEKPDVVHILTPPKFHAQLAIQAMENGCHVIVEKPMALSYEDAIQMVTTAKKTRRHLTVCEMYLFDPVVIKARRMIAKGDIGELIYMENYWFTDVTGESSAYSLKGHGSGWAHSLPGGVFANFMDHPVYLLREFIGEINTINTSCKKVGNNPFLPYDELRISVSANGKTGYIVSSLNGKPRINLLKLYGTEGIITADISNMTITTLKNRRLPSFVNKGVNNLSQSYELARDTINTTIRILRKKIKARQGLRTLLISFYDRLILKSANFDDSLIFNYEKAAGTTRVLGKIWESLQIGEENNRCSHTKFHINHSYTTSSSVTKNDNKRKVLVTGAGGFLGSDLVKDLLKQDLVVRVIIRKINKGLEENENVEVLYGDIRDPESVERAVDGVDTIYHLASLTTNKGSWRNFVETNINATKNLLESASKFGINKFVYVSSVVVYGFSKKLRGKTVCEKDGYGKDFPLYSYYAKSKIAAEKLALEYYHQKKLPVVILRPGIIYGPKGKNTFRRKQLIFGAKRKILPYIYIKDVVAALLLAEKSNNAIGKAYNVVGDEHPTLDEFKKTIDQIIGGSKTRIYVPLPIMYIVAHLLEFVFKNRKSNSAPPFGIFHYKSLIRNLRYDNSKLKSELGWTPTYSIEDGIKEAYEYIDD